jgi:hypothetical protein
MVSARRKGKDFFLPHCSPYNAWYMTERKISIFQAKGKMKRRKYTLKNELKIDKKSKSKEHKP